MLPFNLRVQLSGSDLKNQVEDRSLSSLEEEDTDHDIQELVAVEDKETAPRPMLVSAVSSRLHKLKAGRIQMQTLSTRTARTAMIA